MGSKNTALEICSYITEVLYMNGKLFSIPSFIYNDIDSTIIDPILCCIFFFLERLSIEDVAAEIEEYIAVHFDTELHDDSDLQIAEDLLRFHRYCMEGNESMATVELEKLPPLQCWLNSTQCTSVPVPRDSSLDKDMDVDDSDKSDDSDEGWTKVTNRKRK